MGFSRKPFFTKTEAEVISGAFGGAAFREKVPGLAATQDAVHYHQNLMREKAVLEGLQDQYGDFRRVAGMNLGTLVACEKFHEAGCSCGQPVFGPGGHKEWFFKFLDLPGVKENHDLRHETVCR